MKIFYTQIQAIDPADGEMKLWAGPKVVAPSYQAALDYCQNNGFGYLEIIGEYVGSVTKKRITDIGREQMN